MAFTQVSKLIPQRLRQNGVEREVLAASTIDMANKALEEMFGADITQQYARAVSCKYRKIYVAAVDATLRQEIKIREKELVAKINQFLQKDWVDSVQVFV